MKLASAAGATRQDGVELPITKQTHAGRPDFTWPLPSDRQRLTNLKLEFPNITATGVWEMQLIDGDGRAVGPVARFVFALNEPNQEMYVFAIKNENWLMSWGAAPSISIYPEILCADHASV
ncbi:MAG: hypothetical protein R2867_23985 [Caldilineaceae bacterium]